MATYMTKDRLGQTITKGQDNEGNPSVQIAGNLSPEEYQMQRYLGERADQERYASLNTPTYSGDPNRIAEGNALAEMQRTGLNQYYHPNSAAYYAAFQGIRDKYLHQEMSKKASIENEGKQLYSNRMGAFDKLIQDQYGIQKEKSKDAGLEALRKAQAKQAEAQAGLYEAQATGDGMTPAQKTQAIKDKRNLLLKEADSSLKAYLAIQNKVEENPNAPRPANYENILTGIRTAYRAKKYLQGGGDPFKMTQYDPMEDSVQSAGTGLAGIPINQPSIQPPKAEGVKLTPEEPPKETANGMKYKTKTDALSAIKELSAADALNVMRANGITKDELREFLNPTKKQQTPRPVTGMPLSFS